MTCGVWRPARLEFYEAKIADVQIHQNVSDDLKKATVSVTVDVDGIGAGYSVHVRMESPRGVNEIVESRVVELLVLNSFPSCLLCEFDRLNAIIVYRKDSAVKTLTVDLSVVNPELWWPVGHGLQNMYTITATLQAPKTQTPIHST
jgi:beta-mannosidase